MIKTKLTRTNALFALKYIFSTFIISVSAFLLLRFPETAGQGISDGIDLCLGTLIPSLLPFMVISSLAVQFNTLGISDRLFSKATNKLLRLPGISVGIIIMSIIGGYPIGGKIIKDLYGQGEITSSQGRRMLLFCVNPGPAFVISSVGFYMLGSKRAGVIMYLSVITSSFIMGILSRFFDNESYVKCETRKDNSAESLSDGIIKSVSSGGKSMLIICTWVILFSGISRLIELFNLSPGINLFLNCVLEVTNGCNLAGGNLSLPVIACIIGFGGVCTHFQVADALRAVNLKYKYFITSRIIHGALSAVICNLFLRFFPVSYNVFSFGTLPAHEVSTTSSVISIAMLTMCALVMLGDRLKIKIRCTTKQVRNTPV